MIQSKINLETRFQLNKSPNKILYFKDITDYASEGIALSDVIGALVIKSPLGTPFHTTTLPAFDIDLDVQDYIDTIALPTDISGDVLKGTYTVEYTIRVLDGAGGSDDYTKEFKYNYCYEEIEPKITIEVDQLCSKLTSTDNTSLPVQTTSTTLTHTITPPVGAQPAKSAQTVATTVNIYSGITTKTWTASISNIIELTFPATGVFSQHYIDVTITGDVEKEIRDDLNLCSLQCNMRAMTERYFENLGTNSINAVKDFNTTVAPALLAAFNYSASLQCGNHELAEKYYNDALKFTGSNKDCDCNASDKPVLIIPTCTSSGGGGFNYVVEACEDNNAITVTGNTVGDTTTFTVCFNDAMWSKLQDLTKSLITSSDGSVSVTPSLNGYTMIWDLSVAASAVASFSGIIDIDLTDKSAPPSISWRTGWDSLIGTKLQKPTINNSNPANPDWSNLANCFYLSGYFATAEGKFPKPQFQIVETYPIGSDTINPCTDVRNLTVDIKQIDTANDRIYFQIMDRNYVSSNVNGFILQEQHDKISISVIINA